MQKPKSATIQQVAPLHSVSGLAIPLKVLTVAVAVIALYFQDLYVVFTDALSSETTSYILAIPIIFGYLLYRKRNMLWATVSTEPQKQSGSRYLAMLSGILLCATSVILYYYGSRTFTPLEFHILTLPAFAAGLTLIMFNPQTLRQALFPLLFLFLLSPPPSEILYGSASILSIISSEMSNAIVRAQLECTVMTISS